ncbi:unnamed protein product [Tilletia controversa]|nr:unnamed protein product [Tilletia controversa]CAD7063399.1 unnamed protein product [Tilletia caries]
MDARYEAALKELSVTGRDKDASEIPREGPLRVEREKVVKKCFYFEEWHAMRRDRRTSAPGRIRVGGREGLVAVQKNGVRADNEDDETGDDETGEAGLDEDGDQEGGDDPLGPSDAEQEPVNKAKQEDRKGKKRALSPAAHGPAGGSLKKGHRSSTAVGTLAATMEASIHERQEQAAARQRAEDERSGERLQLERERIELQRMEAETRRLEVINARETQKQQGDLIMALLNKLNQ